MVFNSFPVSEGTFEATLKQTVEVFRPPPAAPPDLSASWGSTAFYCSPIPPSARFLSVCAGFQCLHPPRRISNVPLMKWIINNVTCRPCIWNKDPPSLLVLVSGRTGQSGVWSSGLGASRPVGIHRGEGGAVHIRDLHRAPQPEGSMSATQQNTQLPAAVRSWQLKVLCLTIRNVLQRPVTTLSARKLQTSKDHTAAPKVQASLTEN